MQTNEWISLIDHLTTRPGMFVGQTDFERIAAFINGYNCACNGALLAGFHEWLTMRFGCGHNLVWWALIRNEMLRYSADQETAAASSDEDMLKVLRELLTEFILHRQAIGLRNVYYDHGIWIRQFDWFNENVERYGSSDGPRRTEQTGDQL